MTGNEEAKYRANTDKVSRYNWATKICIRCKRTRSLGSFTRGDVCKKCGGG